MAEGRAQRDASGGGERRVGLSVGGGFFTVDEMIQFADKEDLLDHEARAMISSGHVQRSSKEKPGFFSAEFSEQVEEKMVEAAFAASTPGLPIIPSEEIVDVLEFRKAQKLATSYMVGSRVRWSVLRERLNGKREEILEAYRQELMEQADERVTGISPTPYQQERAAPAPKRRRTSGESLLHDSMKSCPRIDTERTHLGEYSMSHKIPASSESSMAAGSSEHLLNAPTSSAKEEHSSPPEENYICGSAKAHYPTSPDDRHTQTQSSASSQVGDRNPCDDEILGQRSSNMNMQENKKLESHKKHTISSSSIQHPFIVRLRESLGKGNNIPGFHPQRSNTLPLDMPTFATEEYTTSADIGGSAARIARSPKKGLPRDEQNNENNRRSRLTRPVFVARSNQNQPLTLRCKSPASAQSAEHAAAASLTSPGAEHGAAARAPVWPGPVFVPPPNDHHEDDAPEWDLQCPEYETDSPSWTHSYAASHAEVDNDSACGSLSTYSSLDYPTFRAGAQGILTSGLASLSRRRTHNPYANEANEANESDFQQLVESPSYHPESPTVYDDEDWEEADEIEGTGFQDDVNDERSASRALHQESPTTVTLRKLAEIREQKMIEKQARARAGQGGHPAPGPYGSTYSSDSWYTIGEGYRSPPSIRSLCTFTFRGSQVEIPVIGERGDRNKGSRRKWYVREDPESPTPAPIMRNLPDPEPLELDEEAPLQYPPGNLSNREDMEEEH